MAERAAFAGLIAVAAGCAGLATGLGWRAAGLFHQADEFYRSSHGDEAPDVVRANDQISHVSFALQNVMGPLFAGALTAVLAVLVVLALRWEGAPAPGALGGRGWVIGLPVVIAASTVAALALFASASSLTARAEAYFSGIDFATAGPVEIDEAEFEVYNDLAVLANTLVSATGPLLTCALVGAMAWLAVMARRWSAAQRTGAAVAPAAS